MKNTLVVISSIAPRTRFLLVAAFLLISPFFANSQASRRQTAHTPTAAQAAPASSAAQPAKTLSASAAQARRDELAKIPELLADPDANVRAANMEMILKTEDATMVQMALRLAFQSDDANLHALAMRAYIANRKELTFDIAVRPQVQKLYDAALDDPDKMSEFNKLYPYMVNIERAGFRMHAVIDKYNFGNDSGVIGDPERRNNAGQFRISGDRLTATFGPDVNYGYPCSIEIRPTNDLFLRGTLTCQQVNAAIYPRLEISTSIF